MKDRVIKLRKVLGLKQYEFAERLKMKPTTLSMIENGNSILTDKYSDDLHKVRSQ